MATSWSLDFCLVCDRQTLGGAYCSQACRLAEMDGCAAADSEPSSPSPGATSTSLQSPWVASKHAEVQHPSPLHLGLAIDFGGYRFPSSSTPHQETPHNIQPNTSSPSLLSASWKGLTPSSSQTSLSSLHSVSSNSSALSGQARSELENYSGSFDKVRDWKRRRASS
ncbi:hypothetical protein I7I48_04940 [Histoplasma ohiense]|nr:hypothetical protein I7I48_04940 [Histoplasma ohiense (nom. inval.)]